VLDFGGPIQVRHGQGGSRLEMAMRAWRNSPLK
jgi:hypothetical protein